MERFSPTERHCETGPKQFSMVSGITAGKGYGGRSTYFVFLKTHRETLCDYKAKGPDKSACQRGPWRAGQGSRGKETARPGKARWNLLNKLHI